MSNPVPSGSAAPGPAVVLDVALERAGGRELAELVPDHALGDEHRHVLASVMHGDRVAEHVRDDRGPARPRLDHGFAVLVVLRVHLLEQVVVDERALLQAAWHRVLPLLVRTTATDDHLVAGLATTGAALRLAVRVHRMPATGRLALATAVRVVDRVHGDTAHRRALALPAHPAGLAPVDVRLLGIADLADRRAAPDVDVADLAGRHPQLRERAFLGDQLHACAGRAGDLGAAAGPQLDGVHHGADRDGAQRQRVARLDVRARAVLHSVALAQQ